ncbi:hypothetical protein ACFYPG_25590 [Micromonospora sp. NPDC005553]|uniref:hypothetical protein n=1 Tax=Micromonospora sp. NPDC005553 TaxID=3364232 RepID=UPI0036B8CEBA
MDQVDRLIGSGVLSVIDLDAGRPTERVQLFEDVWFQLGDLATSIRLGNVPGGNAA